MKEQAETLEKVTEERDGLQVRNQKMNEFILEFQKRTHSLKMEKQRLFFENHEMQEEMQKSNAEIQQMTEELSEMRKLNQSLQQSNDDLRNRSQTGFSPMLFSRNHFLQSRQSFRLCRLLMKCCEEVPAWLYAKSSNF